VNKCENCGNKIDEIQKICENCGIDLDSENKENEEVVKILMGEATNYLKRSIKRSKTSYAKKRFKQMNRIKRFKLTLMIITLIALISGLIVLIPYLFTSIQPDPNLIAKLRG